MGSADQSVPGRKRIVYVEDELFFATIISRLLAEAGYAISIAEDGEKGLALIRAERPDLVLLDLVLPKIAGKDVLRELKADPATKDIPVVVLSNLSAEADQREMADLGAGGYYVKATTLPSYLIQIVKKRIR